MGARYLRGLMLDGRRKSMQPMAERLGIDPVELRRKNLIPASAMPYKTPLGVSYDCGDFPKNMEDALKVADVAGFAARREASRARGHDQRAEETLANLPLPPLSTNVTFRVTRYSVILPLATSTL